MSNCFICNKESNVLNASGNFTVQCNVCGSYDISKEVIDDENIKNLENSMLGLLRGLVFYKTCSKITNTTINEIKNKKIPSPYEKAMSMLRFLEKENNSISYIFPIEKLEEKLISSCYSSTVKEMLYILYEFLVNHYNFIKEVNKSTKTFSDKYTDVMISPTGWDHLNNLKIKNKKSKKIFCAMWFNESTNELFNNVFSPAIKNCGYEPVRVDLIPHNNKICDQIISEIKSSQCLISDFTGHRGGVYYEAGFAHGLGIPVIFTCEETDLQNIHFDIRQYNFLTWKKHVLSEFIDKIQNRIKATLE